MTPRRIGQERRLLLLIGIGYLALLSVGCSESDLGQSVVVEATLAGRSIAESRPLDPIALHHEEITELSLDVTNVSSRPVSIAHVRLEGQMLNLIFLTYDTGIREVLQPDERRTITFALDFFDLDGQAHGLLRSNVRLFDADRNPLGQQALVIDGRGSPFATMAVFTMMLAALAVAGLVWNIVRLAQRRLPANRFVRGLRFLHSGAVFGLAAVAASSTLRVWPLATSRWVPLMVVFGLAGFVVGYLAPGAEVDLDDDPLDGVDLDVIDLDAARETARPEQGPLRTP